MFYVSIYLERGAKFDTFVYTNRLIGLSLIETPMLISRLNLRLVQIGRKAPPLFCLLMRNQLRFYAHWASHPRPGRKVPPPPISSIHSISSNFDSAGRKTHPLFPPFCERPRSHHTCRIPIVPILQIHTQIPPIQISSLGYQFCQLFKILTYTEVQGIESQCRWKAYRQPYHNLH